MSEQQGLLPETEQIGVEIQDSAPQTASETPQETSSKWETLRNGAVEKLKKFRAWSYIHLRRAVHVGGEALAVNRAVGPITFLAVSAAFAAALTLNILYTTSYAVVVDGETVGVVADKSTVDEAIHEVEEEGSSLLGYEYQVTGNVDYQFGLTLKSELTEQKEIEEFFFSQLDSVSEHLRQCEVSVNGVPVGVVKDEDALGDVLEEIQAQYVNENTVEAGFVEDVTVDYVYAMDDLITADELRETLESNTTGETTYTVQKGDTFNAIAYSNDMSVSDLKALNPQVDINKLMIGDVLNVKETVPVLSVETTEHQTYTQSIPCPVEEREDGSMYKGESKIITQGTEGEKEIEADVTFINGVEKERTVTSETTLREPTTTVKAVGTKEKPKTASKGSFIWPITGRITSSFGGRRIFGSYSFHEGIDISTSYGATIKAADGGTVTFAGYKGSYGKLVIITHDNGIQTYYGHNSSLLVSAGQKVYQGQAIARAGSTGRSTGVHCHFGVKVNGSFVNPRNYLR